LSVLGQHAGGGMPGAGEPAKTCATSRSEAHAARDYGGLPTSVVIS